MNKILTDCILAQAIRLFGVEAQKEMAKEESSELINALCKETRGRASREEIITEIADVQIMTEQLAMIYGEGEVLKEKERKLKRLEERIAEYKTNRK